MVLSLHPLTWSVPENTTKRSFDDAPLLGSRITVPSGPIRRFPPVYPLRPPGLPYRVILHRFRDPQDPVVPRYLRGPLIWLRDPLRT